MRDTYLGISLITNKIKKTASTYQDQLLCIEDFITQNQPLDNNVIKFL